MINVVDEKKCCGCRACIDVCPKKCITTRVGTLGHVFPQVDSMKCINCNLCESVCPLLKDNGSKSIKSSYVAFNKGQNIRSISSSGGLFYSFASWYLNMGYTIYGACFDENLTLKTNGISKIEDLQPLCKSKYLQSDTTGIYRNIKKMLDDGKGVLFCGTPCQVAALKLFVKKDYENLFLIDFFCHGVPSQIYFDKCKELVENKNGIKIVRYQFRTKINKGVTPHYFTIDYLKDNKEKTKTDFYYKSPNYAAFQRYINLRESCYNCKFAKEERNSDITIGDFHDIELFRKDINRFDGVSLVIANTKKGLSILNDIKQDIFIDEIDYKTLEEKNVISYGGTTRPKDRDSFINDYENLSFEELNKKWFNKKKYFKQSIYYHMPRFLRKIAKRMSD